MQLAALEAASEVDPIAAQIGAINTLVRQPDGGLKGYNTDYSAAIEAIEEALEEGGFFGAGCDPEACEVDFGEEPPAAGFPLEGVRVVVLGAGGAGRALAFGAAAKGAKVIVANR
jgi:3-dehydroquinate dehydratase/shikimate dehydrogenase